MKAEMSKIDDILAGDAINHLKDICLRLATCKICFSAKVFAVSFILSVENKKFIKNEFKDRANHIVDGLFLFLQKKSAAAIYVILPQLDGIVKDHLMTAGLLKETDGYPIWTSFASKCGEKCKNIKDAIEEGVTNERSKIGKTHQAIKYHNKLLKSILDLRNKTLHGSLTEVKEHKAVDVIHLLFALYHDLELFEITKPLHQLNV